MNVQIRHDDNSFLCRNIPVSSDANRRNMYECMCYLTKLNRPLFQAESTNASAKMTFTESSMDNSTIGTAFSKGIKIVSPYGEEQVMGWTCGKVNLYTSSCETRLSCAMLQQDVRQMLWQFPFIYIWSLQNGRL